MSTKNKTIQISEIKVLLLKKDIKNLHLNILPPDGKVRVSAPKDMTQDAIRTFLATRISWIKKHRQNFIQQNRQTPRRYISGESHYLFGKRYKLQVNYVEQKPIVKIKGIKEIVLNVRSGSGIHKREKVMWEWYRNELKGFLRPTIQKFQDKIGQKFNEWRIRKMKRSWGTCNEDKKSASFNLKLAQKPKSCIEYIIVHELVHLIESTHNNRFVQYMDQYLPNWKHRKEKLNRQILTHEEWEY
jgi:hypothetical protein